MACAAVKAVKLFLLFSFSVAVTTIMPLSASNVVECCKAAADVNRLCCCKDTLAAAAAVNDNCLSLLSMELKYYAAVSR